MEYQDEAKADKFESTSGLSVDGAPSGDIDLNPPLKRLGTLNKALRDKFFRNFTLNRPGLRNKTIIVIEIVVVVLWALMFTRPYQDLDPAAIPVGREYLSAIQMNHVWLWARDCGSCALWYGSVAGGIPSFADPVGSILHPLVILTTLGWGVVNGSKLALVGVFILVGLGQWWLGFVLKLRPVSRVWSAAMAVVAGHLSARMNLGAFGLFISVGTSTLMFPALIYMVQSRSRRALVVLGTVLGLMGMSSTGYLQIGLALLFPTVIILVRWERKQISWLIRRLLLALGLAVLIAGPFLVPFIHFLPNFFKDYDPTFSSAQPFEYTPLNLAIRDQTFYQTEILGKLPWPSHYVNYIGWVPIVLALYGLFKAPEGKMRRAAVFLFAAAFIALWTASGDPLEWMANKVKVEWFTRLIAGIRYPAFIASLSAPPILGLAAIGLDRLIVRTRRWLFMSIGKGDSDSVQLKVDLRWLLIIPLWLALKQAGTFSSTWIETYQLAPEVKTALQGLKPEDLQWVNVPFGGHFYMESAVGMGLKISMDFFRTWHWKDRPVPEPVLEANLGGPPEGMTELRVVEGVHIHAAPPGREYAAIVHADGSRTVCTAQGVGGNIEVSCDAARGGDLVVKENRWSGWKAKIDDVPVPLLSGEWLSVGAPSGEHTYTFHYRPWDVALGFVLLIMGILISGWILWRPNSLRDPG